MHLHVKSNVLVIMPIPYVYAHARVCLLSRILRNKKRKREGLITRCNVCVSIILDKDVKYAFLPGWIFFIVFLSTCVTFVHPFETTGKWYVCSMASLLSFSLVHCVVEIDGVLFF